MVAVPAGGVGSGTSLQTYAADFERKFPGHDAGAGFLAYAQEHPNLTPAEAASAFALEIAFSGVDTAVQSAISKLAQVLKSTGPAAAAAGSLPGLSGVAAIGDFFNRLGQASTWIRVGEVVLGLILLAVGIAKITNAVPIATKVAKAIK